MPAGHFPAELVDCLEMMSGSKAKFEAACAPLRIEGLRQAPSDNYTRSWRNKRGRSRSHRRQARSRGFAVGYVANYGHCAEAVHRMAEEHNQRQQQMLVRAHYRNAAANAQSSAGFKQPVQCSCIECWTTDQESDNEQPRQPEAQAQHMRASSMMSREQAISNSSQSQLQGESDLAMAEQHDTPYCIDVTMPQGHESRDLLLGASCLAVGACVMAGLLRPGGRQSDDHVHAAIG